jgi:hypothetical protein
VVVPAHIDWDIHRIAASERYSASLTEIQIQWSVEDLYEAHDVLDLYEELDRMQATAKQEHP